MTTKECAQELVDYLKEMKNKKNIEIQQMTLDDPFRPFLDGKVSMCELVIDWIERDVIKAGKD